LPASPDTHHSARLVFRLQVALGTIGLTAVGAAVADAASSVHRVAGSPHEVLVAGQRFSYPAVNVAAAVLLVLAGLGAIVLGTMARGVWRQLRAYRRFVRSIPLLGPLPGYPGVSVIDDPGAQVFCAGYLRPRVYISRGALELLSGEELRAVLSHEDRHRSTRDPLRFACGRILSQALFFLPALPRSAIATRTWPSRGPTRPPFARAPATARRSPRRCSRSTPPRRRVPLESRTHAWMHCWASRLASSFPRH
jgi:Zn-dependent protease with chaperone function